VTIVAAQNRRSDDAEAVVEANAEQSRNAMTASTPTSETEWRELAREVATAEARSAAVGVAPFSDNRRLPSSGQCLACPVSVPDDDRLAEPLGAVTLIRVSMRNVPARECACDRETSPRVTSPPHRHRPTAPDRRGRRTDRRAAPVDPDTAPSRPVSRTAGTVL
jgi:hypothetical protein